MINTEIEEITKYYDNRVETEWYRLDRYKMEHAISKRVINQITENKKLSICDVGGGPGRYSFWLAENGHKVSLLDLSKQNIDFAKFKSQETGINLELINVANAIDLSMISDNTYDIVLLMGPLYHLTNYQDRLKAVNEAYRILKPSGTIVASAISKMERLRYLAAQDPEFPARNFDEIERILTKGATSGGMDVGLEKTSFTIAHFTDTKNLIDLMKNGGFKKKWVQGIEVINGRQDDGINECSQEAFESWVEINYQLGKDPSFQNSADHLIYIGEKE